jgi:antirestriction protein ArdC
LKIHDLYKQVTDSIIRDLEAGAPTWLKPWKDGTTSGLMPQNAATGRPYSGINICLLWGARDEHGWPTSEYMTFKQALAKGAGVRKGERGTQIVFMRKLTVTDKETEEQKKVGMLRAYTVFSIQQIDGLPAAKARSC